MRNIKQIKLVNDSQWIKIQCGSNVLIILFDYIILKTMKWLIYGANGWIGGMVVKLLQDQGEEVISAESRADNEVEVEKELLKVQPDRVISLIGRTHGPGFNTIDYLEQKGKLVENMRDNLYAPLILAMLCTKYGFHYTYLGTGCIYGCLESEYDSGYTDEEDPDFFGSSYSIVKGFSHRLLKFFKDNVLTVKIRMPITADVHPRNFITKITRYSKICSIKNSMTVLPDLLPVMIDLAKRKVTGPINLTNPEVISHNEILELYKEIVDPTFTWQNFSLEEQSQILLSGRSNNMLNTNRLINLYPNVLPIKEAVRKVLYEMKENMNK
jgi:3,5-epimerase/4-reductase